MWMCFVLLTLSINSPKHETEKQQNPETEKMEHVKFDHFCHYSSKNTNYQNTMVESENRKQPQDVFEMWAVQSNSWTAEEVWQENATPFKSE